MLPYYLVLICPGRECYIVSIWLAEELRIRNLHIGISIELVHPVDLHDAFDPLELHPVLSKYLMCYAKLFVINGLKAADEFEGTYLVASLLHCRKDTKGALYPCVYRLPQGLRKIGICASDIIAVLILVDDRSGFRIIIRYGPAFPVSIGNDGIVEPFAFDEDHLQIGPLVIRKLVVLDFACEDAADLPSAFCIGCPHRIGNHYVLSLSCHVFHRFHSIISTIDIANVISEQITPKEWIGYLISFASVFLGAYFAYRFNNVQEKHKDKKQLATAYEALSNQIALSLNNIFTYKETYLDRIKLAFNEDKYDEVLKTSYRPDCYFGFDVEKYYFLSGYNRCFLPELSLLTQINRVVMEEINNYYQNVYEVLYIYNNNKDAFNSEYERLKKRFELMYNDVEHLCARIYYINKEFIKGYEKFFNSLSYEGLIDNYEIEANINNRISNPENITIMLQREKMFDVYWSLDTNIFCHFCWLKRKLKNIFRAIGKYFQKPKICENCRCCKIKAEKK